MHNLNIRQATLPQDLPTIHHIRYLVFQVEQGVDPALEFDGLDDQSDHVLVFQGETAIGTARIRYLSADTVKLERFAIVREARGLGVGRELMHYILDGLPLKPIKAVVMNAQVSVREFYEKFGFAAEGNVFEEAGIPHIRMKKLLR